MTYQAPVGDIAFALKHGAGFSAALGQGLFGDLGEDTVEARQLERGAGPVDRDHLGVRAFERLTPADGWTFRWTDRIPRARGLGSSAATVALGLVAGELARGGAPDPETLLTAGVDLEGHADNLAAALSGGVCLTWEGRIARIGDTAPAAAIVVVPETTVALSTCWLIEPVLRLNEPGLPL